MSFSTPPQKATLPLKSFTINTPQSDLDDLKTFLRLTRVPKETYENTQTEDNLGITRRWFEDSKKAWEGFDWRKQESRINSIPAFIAPVQTDTGDELNIHFMALFSTKSDAIPIIFSHGWPGCFLEFLPMLEMVKGKYTPETLPYHFIVPSLPGFAFSSKPPLDKDFAKDETAYLIDKLMTGLGFDKYVAQGGDIGSAISWVLGTDYPACVAVHLNAKFITSPPPNTPEAKNMKPPGPGDMMKGLEKFGYAIEQATRPATVGLVVGCNPMSLLGWIGEKYLGWSDISPSLETILTITTLYWLTDTYPSSIWHYRNSGLGPKPPKPEAYLTKPLGYSLFPKEIAQVPPHWVKETGDLVWSTVDHKHGGHFAALEQPEELWKDVEEFLGVAWGMEAKGKEGE